MTDLPEEVMLRLAGALYRAPVRNSPEAPYVREVRIILSALTAEGYMVVRGEVARPESEWTEEDGDVLWWCWHDGGWLGEPPYIGSPLDLGKPVECHTQGVHGDMLAARFMVGGWPGYHTHWTPCLPPPLLPAPESD